MKRWIGVCVAICLCVVIAGCKKASDDQADVRAAIEKHLTERQDLNLGAMDREVKQVTVNGDKANAQVEFRLKEGDAKMEIEYDLERQNKEWKVTNSQPMGMGDAVHPGPGNMPAGGQ
jgi:hypothetical protein